MAHDTLPPPALSDRTALTISSTLGSSQKSLNIRVVHIERSSAVLPSLESPELIFGLCSPLGTDNKKVRALLRAALLKYRYNAVEFKVTDLMKSFNLKEKTLEENPLEKRYESYIDYANTLRDIFQEPGLLAMISCGAVKGHRRKSKKLENEILPRTAYIFDQFKRQEEIEVLRQVYGRLFVLVSVYSDKSIRSANLAERIAESHAVSRPDQDHNFSAIKLITKDENEDGVKNGQRLQEAFPLGDLFIDIDDHEASEKTVDRFLKALFGSVLVSPTPEEFGMYLAKSASLRSLDLSRQVGSAIVRGRDDVVALGCNEVPRANGGQYWTGDVPDERDYHKGHDENDRIKRAILADVIRRLIAGEYVKSDQGVDKLVDFVLTEVEVPDNVMRQSELMDLLEFGRIIHAEMAALCEAAREGKTVKGATLYCTTFPCHICAKHIVASGVKRVLFIEPYPKSYAESLHKDSITVKTGPIPEDKVQFEPFIGISPYRFRELFQRTKRKDRQGKLTSWSEEKANPIVHYTVPSYLVDELATIKILKTASERLAADGKIEMRGADALLDVETATP